MCVVCVDRLATDGLHAIRLLCYILGRVSDRKSFRYSTADTQTQVLLTQRDTAAAAGRRLQRHRERRGRELLVQGSSFPLFHFTFDFFFYLFLLYDPPKVVHSSRKGGTQTEQMGRERRNQTATCAGFGIESEGEKVRSMLDTECNWEIKTSLDLTYSNCVRLN